MEDKLTAKNPTIEQAKKLLRHMNSGSKAGNIYGATNDDIAAALRLARNPLRYQPMNNECPAEAPPGAEATKPDCTKERPEIITRHGSALEMVSETNRNARLVSIMQRGLGIDR